MIKRFLCVSACMLFTAVAFAGSARNCVQVKGSDTLINMAQKQKQVRRKRKEEYTGSKIFLPKKRWINCLDL